MSACRFCPAEVTWVTNGGSGRLMCLDPEPTPDGNVIVNWPTRQAEVVSDPAERERLLAAGQTLYRDHHSTCPAAKRVDAGELVGQSTLF